MPSIYQQQTAVDQRSAVQRDGGGIFKANAALIGYAPHLAFDLLFPAGQIGSVSLKIRGGIHIALPAAKLIHAGVELHLGFGVFSFNAVAGSGVIIGYSHRAQVKNADPNDNDRRQNTGQAQKRHERVTLDLVNLLVGICTHTIPPFLA